MTLGRAIAAIGRLPARRPDAPEDLWVEAARLRRALAEERAVVRAVLRQTPDVLALAEELAHLRSELARRAR